MKKTLLVLLVTMLSLASFSQYVVKKDIDYKGRKNTNLFFKENTTIVIDTKKNEFYVNYSIYNSCDSLNYEPIGHEHYAIPMSENLKTLFLIEKKAYFKLKYKLKDNDIIVKEKISIIENER